MSYSANEPSGTTTDRAWRDRIEKAVKLATTLAGLALLLSIVALILAIIAITDDDEKGDGSDSDVDSRAAYSAHAWV